MGKVVCTMLVAIGVMLGVASCTDQMDPLGVTAHPEGWSNPGSPVFHGRMVLESAKNADSCASCHGETYDGGTSGVTCYASGCHAVYPHPDGFTDTQADGFHGRFIAERGLWDLSTCRSCHGTDYAGEGDVEKNCLNCHSQREGPEACNTCHGSATSLGPPPDVLGHTSPTFRGVGAHEPHTGAKRWTTAMTPECSQCHTVPTSNGQDGHLGDGAEIRAELLFKLVATGYGRVTPVWDADATTCTNVYCHGGFSFNKADSDRPWAYAEDAITGNNPTLTWTDVGSGAAECGTCHGLPPTGHIPVTTCNGCHGDVVDANNNIIDRGKHINGKIDVN